MGACAGLGLLGAAAGLLIPAKRRPTEAEPQLSTTQAVLEIRR
jgi:hypothetical protein